MFEKDGLEHSMNNVYLATSGREQRLIQNANLKRATWQCVIEVVCPQYKAGSLESKLHNGVLHGDCLVVVKCMNLSLYAMICIPVVYLEAVLAEEMHHWCL